MSSDTPGGPGAHPDHATLDEGAAQDLLRGICFKTGPPRIVGVELEWLVHDPRESRRPGAPRTARRRRRRPARTAPELRADRSSPAASWSSAPQPAGSLMECIGTDRGRPGRRPRLARPGRVSARSASARPWHPPRRMLHEPRYDAMEACSRPGGPGRAGHDVHLRLRAGLPGRRARGAGPARLRAALAARASARRRPGGRVRQLAVPAGPPDRLALHPAGAVGRSRPGTDAGAAPPGRDAARRLGRARAGRAGDVRPRATRAPGTCPEGLTFREWIRDRRAPAADRADLDYHLTTLFPPVRPRGHLELRMIDAQPGDGRLDRAAGRDDRAVRRPGGRRDRVPRRSSRWPSRRVRGPRRAIRCGRRPPATGLADPELRAAAAVCFAAALEALPRLGADTAVRDAVAAFTDRYVARGRCPADDLLDAPRLARPGRTR